MFIAPIETFEFFVIVCNKTYDSPGEKPKKKHQHQLKNYLSILEEEKERRKIFSETLETVILRQCEFDNKDRTYDSGINCFSDLTAQEFAARFTGQGSLGGGVCRNGESNFNIDPNLDPYIFSERIDRRHIKDYYGAPTTTPKELDWSQRGNSPKSPTSTLTLLTG